MLFHTSALRAKLFMLHFSLAEAWCSYVHQTFAVAQQPTSCSKGQAGGQRDYPMYKRKDEKDKEQFYFPLQCCQGKAGEDH